MELDDPRLISRVQSGFIYLLSYRLAQTGPNADTVNHITVNMTNVLTILLGAIGIGLLFAHVSSRINASHRQLKGLIDTVGWGFLILMPAMTFWVSWTPSLTYGSIYWNYLALIWYGGLYSMTLIFAGTVVFPKSISKILAKRFPNKWKFWREPVSPIYQAWKGIRAASILRAR